MIIIWRFISFNLISGFIQTSKVTDVGQILYRNKAAKSIKSKVIIEPNVPSVDPEPEEPEDFVPDNYIYYKTIDNLPLTKNDFSEDSKEDSKEKCTIPAGKIDYKEAFNVSSPVIRSPFFNLNEIYFEKPQRKL